jgi:hypothetical protein
MQQQLLAAFYTAALIYFKILKAVLFTIKSWYFYQSTSKEATAI